MKEMDAGPISLREALRPDTWPRQMFARRTGDWNEGNTGGGMEHRGVECVGGLHKLACEDLRHTQPMGSEAPIPLCSFSDRMAKTSTCLAVALA